MTPNKCKHKRIESNMTPLHCVDCGVEIQSTDNRENRAKIKQIKMLKDFALKTDRKGLAKSHQESQIKLGAKEWEKLIEYIRQDERKEIRERLSF